MTICRAVDRTDAASQHDGPSSRTDAAQRHGAEEPRAATDLFDPI